METQNYSKGNKSLIYALLIVGLLFICCSCGARKSDVTKKDIKLDAKEVSKEVTTETTEKTAETNVKIETQKTIDTKTNVVTETVKVTPIDNSKPASFKDDSGKVLDLTNSAYEKSIKSDLSSVNEKLNTLELKTIKELEKALKQSKKDKELIISLREQLKNKKVDKEAFNIFSLWWVLLLIIGCVLYYRKWGFRLPFKL